MEKRNNRKMGLRRNAFQGVWNILRFNWHFYAIASAAISLLLAVSCYWSFPYDIGLLILALLTMITINTSLLVSYYIYDVSSLYKLEWLGDLSHQKILTVNAGFDETSELIQHKFKTAELITCDFYNPKTHTEISIRRARKAYPPSQQTISVSTHSLPFPNQSFDKSLAILSTHEIRDEKERIHFFKELHRITKPQGEVIVTEHLRDFWNFTAFTFGFFHFHSRHTWLQTFGKAKWRIKREYKITPYITTFVLEHNGNTS